MKYTNLNINNSTDSFIYITGLENNVSQDNMLSYVVDGNNIVFFGDRYNQPRLCRKENEWIELPSNYQTGASNEHIPEQFSESQITVYFPEFSVDTYEKKVRYAIDIVIHIREKNIYLGSFVLNRYNSVACDKVERFLNYPYYECIKLIIPNPEDIIYGDAWADFRKNICLKSFQYSSDEWINSRIWDDNGIWMYNAIETNNDISDVSVSIHPIELIDDKYIKMEGYTGCQGFIPLTVDDNHLSLNIRHNIYESSSNRNIICRPVFNDIYNDSGKKIFENLCDYTLETYGSTPDYAKLEVVIQDSDNIYRIKTKIIDPTSDDGDWNFDIFDDSSSNISSTLYFEGWQDWIGEKLYINGSLELVFDEKSDQSPIIIKSNKIAITEKLFGFLIKDNDIAITNIAIPDDMNNITINAVNKTVNEIKVIESAKNNKSHFANSVFYRTQPLSNIIIHPSVTENICINLDAYKARVKYFKIQIENTLFIELGQNNNGTIFKIVGNNLPGTVDSGTYYILDENGELVTYGKYTYEY